MKAGLEVSNAYFDSAYLIMQKLKNYQEQVAKEAGISRSTLSLMEKGNTSVACSRCVVCI
jgi:transcriptional regulator with XRE-family HTH domain